ncbi:MAG: hypothetical protein COV75_08455 [Candidatus Omnitrophica bacterium CG11_big_fil_rev_8_21_14_0_20_63_9]|nr:MAG: hypothetical protein COV75_08455 [Candidatus Omnitrophica bacterium CG11_big_fil_rev_8_21_14_0_20_63_9]
MGEVLKLHAWCPGELLIQVDPRQSGAAFAAAVHTLPAGSAVPIHRLSNADIWLVFLKGQGRLTVQGHHSMVVPGTTAFVPRQSWQGLRNTGNGVLQFAWVSAPAGVEEFFRDLSRFSSAPESSALREIAARRGVELQPEGEAVPAAAPGPRPGRRRRHRGGRGRGARSQTPGQSASPAASAPPAPSPVPSVPQAAPAAAMPAPSAAPQPGGGRRRRHRGRGRGQGPHPPQAHVPPSAAGAPSSPAPAAKVRPSSKPSSKPPRSGGRPYRRSRFKEVYMGGRWVRVSGEGPVISSEHGEAEKGSDE